MRSPDHDEARPSPTARASSTSGRLRTPRQSRGQQRVADILHAAEVLFGDVGIDATGTTAIAARAGASVGSLYYFFPGKDAILAALATQFAAMSGTVIAAAVDDDEHGPLGRVVQDLAALILAHPAFCAVFDACGRHACESGETRSLHEACVDQMGALLAARCPGMPADQRQIAAALVVSVLFGVFKELHAIPCRSRPRVLRELQAMVAQYAAPCVAEPCRTRTPSAILHGPPGTS